MFKLLECFLTLRIYYIASYPYTPIDNADFASDRIIKNFRVTKIIPLSQT